MNSRFIPLIMVSIFLCIVSCKNGSTPTEQNSHNGNTITGQTYKIVFTSNRDLYRYYQLYIMDMDGSNQTRLTQDSLSYYHPRFSPDGSTIVFYSCVYDHNDEIYSINSDGSDHKNLTNTPGNDDYPQFSPDGSKIVFTSDRDGNREIYIMDADGTNQQRLTDNSVVDHAPHFSPDGSKILFFSVDENWRYRIYTVDVDGNNLTNLTGGSRYSHFPLTVQSTSYNVYLYGPQYSPDGSKIVFVSYSSSELNHDIYMMNSDGSNQTRLTNTPGFNFAPRFSPGGSRIVFMTHRGRNFDIYQMDLEGNNQIPIYDSYSGHAVFSQFSPDGSKILLVDDNTVSEVYKVYIMNSDGSNPTQLTQGSYVDFSPQFQPCPD